MKGDVFLQPLEVKCNPLTSSKKKIERKKTIRDKIKQAIGKDLEKIRKRSQGKPLFLDVTFYLVKSEEKGRSKKDLDNLLKILCDALSDDMVANNKNDELKGLGFMKDDECIFKINCEKILLEEKDKDKEGLRLSISEWSES